MKVFAALLLASAGIALAKPSHLHRHMHPKRDEVEIVYQLGDQLISEAEALEGLKNGTFIYLNGGVVAASKTETAQPTTTAPAAVETPKEEPKPQAAAAAPQQQPDYGDDSTAGVDKDFPDGTIDCSHFPSEYGAVPLPWLNLDGWAGVQKPNVEDAGGYADIYTQKGDLCGDGECCSPGSFCSYACPDGYTKTQWPSKQGATGQSVGGLYCDGGKLTLPNGGLSNKLCMPGSEQVQLVVENRLDRSVSICSTDYPGESTSRSFPPHHNQQSNHVSAKNQRYRKHGHPRPRQARRHQQAPLPRLGESLQMAREEDLGPAVRQPCRRGASGGLHLVARGHQGGQLGPAEHGPVIHRRPVLGLAVPEPAHPAARVSGLLDRVQGRLHLGLVQVHGREAVLQRHRLQRWRWLHCEIFCSTPLLPSFPFNLSSRFLFWTIDREEEIELTTTPRF